MSYESQIKNIRKSEIQVLFLSLQWVAIKFLSYYQCCRFQIVMENTTKTSKVDLKIIGEDMEIVNLATNWQSSIRA